MGKTTLNNINLRLVCVIVWSGMVNLECLCCEHCKGIEGDRLHGGKKFEAGAGCLFRSAKDRTEFATAIVNW